MKFSVNEHNRQFYIEKMAKKEDGDKVLINVKPSAALGNQNWSEIFYVQSAITIDALINALKEKRHPPNSKIIELEHPYLILPRESTLAQNGITASTTIIAYLV